MAKYRLDWKSSEFVHPALNAEIASCKITNKPAITYCGGWLIVEAANPQQAIRDYKRACGPHSRDMEVSCTAA